MLKIQVMHRIIHIIHRFILTYPQGEQHIDKKFRHISVDKVIIIAAKLSIRQKYSNLVFTFKLTKNSEKRLEVF